MGRSKDLGLPYTRFPRLRFPDAALANGLFLSILLWPATISLEVLSIAAATVGLRHLLRRGGHPLANPAALGVTLAATVFALPQPWHVGTSLTDTILVIALGAILWTQAWPTWRLWGVFLATNLGAVAAVAWSLAGPPAMTLAVEAAALGPAPMFYAFFMVPGPRTAPSARRPMAMFRAVAGTSAAVLPVLFAEAPLVSALGVLVPYLALFLGNLLAVILPSSRGVHRPARRAWLRSERERGEKEATPVRRAAG